MLSAKMIQQTIHPANTVNDLEALVKRRLYMMPSRRQVRQMIVLQRYYSLLCKTMDEDSAKRHMFETYIKKYNVR